MIDNRWSTTDAYKYMWGTVYIIAIVLTSMFAIERELKCLWNSFPHISNKISQCCFKSQDRISRFYILHLSSQKVILIVVGYLMLNFPSGGSCSYKACGDILEPLNFYAGRSPWICHFCPQSSLSVNFVFCINMTIINSGHQIVKPCCRTY